jgi:poly(beta-D-mannuronate) lyase
VNAFPNNGNLTSNSNVSYKDFLLPTVAEDTKYIKIIGYGQPSGSK